MTEDRWFRLVNDDIADIPLRVERMKSKYWRNSLLFIVLCVVGGALMGFARASSQAAIGCFLAVSGVAGILACATMCHTELCLYRMLKEIRQSSEPAGKQGDG